MFNGPCARTFFVFYPESLSLYVLLRLVLKQDQMWTCQESIPLIQHCTQHCWIDSWYFFSVNEGESEISSFMLRALVFLYKNIMPTLNITLCKGQKLTEIIVDLAAICQFDMRLQLSYLDSVFYDECPAAPLEVKAFS